MAVLEERRRREFIFLPLGLRGDVLVSVLDGVRDVLVAVLDGVREVAFRVGRALQANRLPLCLLGASLGRGLDLHLQVRRGHLERVLRLLFAAIRTRICRSYRTYGVLNTITNTLVLGLMVGPSAGPRTVHVVIGLNVGEAAYRSLFGEGFTI